MQVAPNYAAAACSYPLSTTLHSVTELDSVLQGSIARFWPFNFAGPSDSRRLVRPTPRPA